MEKLPRALVELLEFGVGTGSAGLKPAMTTRLAGLVTSSTVIQVALPKPLISLEPLMVIGLVTTGELSVPVPAVVGLTVTSSPRISGARLMANEPRPKVEASIRSGSGVAVGLAAVRLWEPLAVASAGSVMLPVELETVTIVVPAGMPVPTTLSPAISPVRLLTPVTDSDPLVSVPVKT